MKIEIPPKYIDELKDEEALPVKPVALTGNPSPEKDLNERIAVAIKVICVERGSGASELTKYISEHKRHPEREKEARELFGQDVGGLKDSTAIRHLTRGLSNQVQKTDVFHFVISPAAKAFERYGETDDDRKEVYKGATRRTMREIEREVGASELRWVAAIHLNTNTPHIHVLVHKDFEDKNNNPRRFHWLPSLDPCKTDPAKLLHNRFEQNLKELHDERLLLFSCRQLKYAF